MLGAKLVAEVDVTLALNEMNWVNLTLSIDVSTRKPVSFDELSVQLRLICEELAAVAVNPLGAAGGVVEFTVKTPFALVMLPTLLVITTE